MNREDTLTYRDFITLECRRHMRRVQWMRHQRTQYIRDSMARIGWDGRRMSATRQGAA